MNSILKRMFEDDNCSREEANLKAAILGKTYEECRVEWSKQFKKEFILANFNLVTVFNEMPDNNNMHYFIIRMKYYDMYKTLIKNILRCDNVACTLENGFQQFTISFHADEIDKFFMDAVKNNRAIDLYVYNAYNGIDLYTTYNGM